MTQESKDKCWFVLIAYKDTADSKLQLEVGCTNAENATQAQAHAIGAFMIIRGLDKLPHYVEILRCCKGTAEECAKMSEFIGRGKW